MVLVIFTLLCMNEGRRKIGIFEDHSGFQGFDDPRQPYYSS
jgi:hypothetical protein